MYAMKVLDLQLVVVASPEATLYHRTKFQESVNGNLT